MTFLNNTIFTPSKEKVKMINVADQVDQKIIEKHSQQQAQILMQFVDQGVVKLHEVHLMVREGIRKEAIDIFWELYL